MSWRDEIDKEYEARVREIVREEMARARVTQTGHIETGLYAGDMVGKRPKTDLERAAEICHAEAGAWTAQGDYKREWAATRCAQRIQGLPPSPDWRKIAEGLAEPLHQYHHGQTPNRLSSTLALDNYDRAVKESQ